MKYTLTKEYPTYVLRCGAAWFAHFDTAQQAVDWFARDYPGEVLQVGIDPNLPPGVRFNPEWLALGSEADVEYNFHPGALAPLK